MDTYHDTMLKNLLCLSHSFKRIEDRLALTDHLLTGEVFGLCDRHGTPNRFRANNANAVGSMTMWQGPNSNGK